MTTNKELMAQAREALIGNWTNAVIATIVYMAVIGISSLIPGLPLLIGGPLVIGFLGICLAISRGESFQLVDLFNGFKKNAISNIVVYLLMALAVIVGTILFIIPGIILSFGLMCTFFIILDNPEIKPIDALKKSYAMMKGYKMNLFMLMLRFIGWAILSVITFGIGYLFLIPYMYVSIAKFYNEIKDLQPAQ